MATQDGSKWTVEKVKDKTDIVIEPKEVKESVGLYNCEGTVVTVKGKCTNVSLTNCKKCAVVVDSVVAMIEVTRSPGTQIQVNESVPSIQVDNTEGVTIYLQSADSRKAEVITSSSTQVNIILAPEGDGDATELNVPEQFKNTISADGKLVTEAVSHI